MKKLNAFIPYALGSTGMYDWCGKAAKSDKTLGVIEQFMARDPGATDWGSMGLTFPIEDGRPVHDLDGTARVLCYQFNERILPGSVRDEKLRDEIKRISTAEDRVLNKKEYAQIKEDVEYALLPKAFIRRSLVPVLVFPQYLLIFTTSFKKAEAVMLSMMILASTRKIEFEVNTIETSNSIGHFLGQMARDGESPGGDNDDDGYLFFTKDAGVFKGADKRAIRIKDRDISSCEVHDILGQPGYVVSELLMRFDDVESVEEVLSFVLTDRFVVKAIKLSDVYVGDYSADADDKHVTTWLMAKTSLLLLTQILACLNEEDVSADTEEL